MSEYGDIAKPVGWTIRRPTGRPDGPGRAIAARTASTLPRRTASISSAAGVAAGRLVAINDETSTNPMI
jgi:hypothetical protein